jgi:nucleotide-binding universal stress UspA family protein
MGTIVLGYDASPGAERALDQAVELASTFGDRLVIGFGIQPPGHGGGEGMEHRQALREQAVQLTGDALTRALEANVEAEVSLVDERPAVALADLGEQHDARMIVVGSYGESPIKGAILGSTPHKLLHISERPVLVVPGWMTSGRR